MWRSAEAPGIPSVSAACSVCFRPPSLLCTWAWPLPPALPLAAFWVQPIGGMRKQEERDVRVFPPPRFTTPTGCPPLHAACSPGLWLEPWVAMASHVCWPLGALLSCVWSYNPTQASGSSPFIEDFSTQPSDSDFCFLPRLWLMEVLYNFFYFHV